jgi:hypothetical protein
MRRPWRFLVLAATLAVAVPVLAVGDPEPTELARNQALVEKWRRTEPEHYQRLRDDLRDFYRLPAGRREQMRQLDRDLNWADRDTRKRLWGVLDRYATWLKRLPEGDRARVLSARSTDERLAVVRALRERQWVEGLPAGVRAELDKLDPGAKRERLEQLRKEARNQRLQWQLLRPTKLNEFPAEVQKFVRATLEPMLGDGEKKEFAAAEQKPWPALALLILRLADAHPVLPPRNKEFRTFNELPPRVKWLVKAEPDQKKRQQLLRPASGKWPDFALKVAELLGEKKNAPGVPPLGASRPREFPAATREFIVRRLLPRLNKSEAEELESLLGRWPEYPRQVLKLAGQKHLVVPGMSLPGPRGLWQRARQGRP